ncbi:MAG: hypothetical protein PUG87_09750 [Eubacteriales bacterium]|nr:hypothetical protein [Eubacteriales bacterium]
MPTVTAKVTELFIYNG